MSMKQPKETPVRPRRKSRAACALTALALALLCAAGARPVRAAGELPGVWLIDPDRGTIYGDFVQSTQQVCRGTYSGKRSVPAGTLIVSAMNFASADLSAYVYGWIHMSVYVEDASGFTSHAYFEISSGGQNNVEEMGYQMMPVGFQDGWNHFVFKLSEGEKEGGDINWSAVNWSRVVLQNDNGNEVFIDGVYVTMN